MLSSFLIRYYFSKRRTRQHAELSAVAEEEFDKSISSAREVHWPQTGRLIRSPQRLVETEKSSNSWGYLLVRKTVSRFLPRSRV
jgi:hypothetical protein